MKEQLIIRLNQAIQSVLASQPACKTQLETMPDTVVVIALTDLAIRLYGQIAEGKLILLANYDGPVSVTLSGTTVALFFTGLHAVSQDAPHPMSSVTITGDIHQAVVIQKLLKSLSIDWGALCADCVGEKPASALHFVGSIFHRARQTCQDKSQHTMRDLLNRYAITREEQAVFCQQVDALMTRLDRLEAQHHV